MPPLGLDEQAQSSSQTSHLQLPTTSYDVFEISSDEDDGDFQILDHDLVPELPANPKVKTQLSTFGLNMTPEAVFGAQDQSSDGYRATQSFYSSKRRKLSHAANSQFEDATPGTLPSLQEHSVFDVDNYALSTDAGSPPLSHVILDHTIIRPPPHALGPATSTDDDNHASASATLMPPAVDVYKKYSSLLQLHASGKRSKLPPYYDDQKLGLRMYRGPGYEDFPIPLGTEPEHLAICKIWDQVHMLKHKRDSMTKRSVDESGSCVDYTIILDSDDEYDYDSDEYVSRHSLDCLANVVEVLPDISLRFVLDMIQSMSHNPAGEPKAPSAQDVLTELLELKAYPKQQPLDFADGDETGATIKAEKGNQGQPGYEGDAVLLLAEEFTTVPTHYISKMVKQHRSLFDAYLEIQQHETHPRPSKDVKRPYSRLRQPRAAIEKKYARNTQATRDLTAWARVVQELQAAKQHFKRSQVQEDSRKGREASEAANLQVHIEGGNLTECRCCFDDEVPINRSVHCNGVEAHCFCFTCIERLAGTNTGSGRYEMRCMDQSGCQAELDTEGVSKAVPSKVLSKLAFNQQLAEVTAADIPGLEKCPHCDFQGICERIEVDPVFSCLDPECGRVTCRLCLQPAHSPKTCDQVKREQGLSESRHAIEEARSLAMMRTCPQCQKKVIKESGCNKMYCTCGGMLCFVCQKDISKEGYKHFRAGGCPQHDGGFDRHDHDANQAEREAIKRIRASNTEFEEQELQIMPIAGQSRAHQANPIPFPMPMPVHPLLVDNNRDQVRALIEARTQELRQIYHQQAVAVQQRAHAIAGRTPTSNALNWAFPGHPAPDVLGNTIVPNGAMAATDTPGGPHQPPQPTWPNTAPPATPGQLMGIPYPDARPPDINRRLGFDPRLFPMPHPGP